MNPALLHHPSPFDLPLASLAHDRSYPNLPSYSTNDYGYPHRRTPNGLTNPGLAATLTNSSLDYNAQPPLTDGPCHQNPNGVLSPPESHSGTLASPYTHSTLPKPFASNASASDAFAGASAAILSTHWGDPAMTSLDRSRLTTIPPPLTPPVTFATSGGGIPVASHILNRNNNLDRPFPPYPPGSLMASSYGGMRPPSNTFPYRNSQYQSFPQDHGYHPGNGHAMAPTEPTKPEGPPFGKTVLLHKVYSHSQMDLKPEIAASIQKGFFQVDQKWTCYRRNYFTVQCSFSLKPLSGDGRYYLSIHDRLRPIDHFAVSISAKTATVNNQESELRGLVQHTPKRDKATEKVPERQPVSPAPAHPHHGGLNNLMGMLPNTPNHMMHGYHSFESQGQQTPPQSHVFERIQFQKATANNGKRRAQQQYFHVVVELSACIQHPVDGEDWVIVATRESEPMVVRGRSPGHYRDNNNRRDSQTSMDPDGRTGGGSDGSGSYGYTQRSQPNSSIDWASRPSGQNNYHGCGGQYRSCGVTEGSRMSRGSSATLTESPTETEFTMSEAGTLKSPLMFGQSTLGTGSDAEEGFFNFSRSPFSRKRPFEEDSADEDSPYHCNPPFGDGLGSNPFDLPGLAHSKALCASS